MKSLFCIGLLIFACSWLQATTWDEPWQGDILKEAEYMVLAEVSACEPSSGLTLDIKDAFGSKLKRSIDVSGFFMLDICSQSGEEPTFNFEVGETCYFLLKKGKKGKFQMPTPTSGYAKLVDGEVYATYRHSYHQTLVPQEVYELTYREIWNFYRTQTYTPDQIEPFILRMATMVPAELVEEEIEVFFLQHAALETAFHLQVPIDFGLLRGFVESDNFHAQISALRAMQFAFLSSGPKQLERFLIATIQETERDPFTQLMAVLTLGRMHHVEGLQALRAIKDTISNEKPEFAGNLMDPRACTHLPTPREAAEAACKRLD